MDKTVLKLVSKKCKRAFNEAPHTAPIDPIDSRKIMGKKVEFQVDP